MLTFVKLGGSLITDKSGKTAFRAEMMDQLAGEIAAALTDMPDSQFLLGHGSGSFGHVPAKEHGTAAGVQTPQQWRGFAEVATVAAAVGFLASPLASAITGANLAVDAGFLVADTTQAYGADTTAGE